MIIKSVKKASAILKKLSDNYPDCLRLDELSRHTGINKSTCIHLLDTLIEEQLVERSGHAVYRLAAGCFYLTRSGRFDNSRISVCSPVLKWLYAKVNQTVLIAEIQNCTKYVVDYIEGELQIVSSPADIIVDDIYRTATGRLILSRMPRENVAEVVYKHGLPRSPDWVDFKTYDEFEKELSELRKKTVVFAESESGGEVSSGIAAEIFDRKGNVGAVGIAYTNNGKEKISLEQRQIYEKYLIKASKEMSRRLSFGG